MMCAAAFEVGAMPPFGMMHGHPVFVERCFVGPEDRLDLLRSHEVT
jgi:prolyl-tRNA editing enzyme YbaK/EbsC (Cys-tRNA(Pro) deacylase)